MNNGPEVVHEGWLIKSPPAKRIFRARWRKRWFVLRQSGELPGQYFLCYYTDKSLRKLKGQIDLDECEQVDTGLQFENSKNKYQHMFDVRTPKRIYYLAADTEDEMMKWVHNVCHVCGLKAYTPEEDAYTYSGAGEEPSTPTTVITEHDLESPPVSPSSTTSAYIPISECFSGPPLTSTSGLSLPTQVYRPSSQFHRVPPHLLPMKRSEPVTNNNISACPSGPSGAGAICDEFYDSPRQLRPPHAFDLISGDLRSSDRRSTQGDWDAQKSPGTDAESSVFTDEEWTGPGSNLGPSGTAHSQRPVVNWETFPSSEGEQGPNVRPSDSSVDLDFSADAGTWNTLNRIPNKFQAGDPKTSLIRNNAPPPPRPPKPSHLLLEPPPPGHNYLNIESVSPASHSADALDKQKIESASSSEPPSPLIATSTPLDGPSAVPGSAVVTDDMYDFPRSHQYADTLDNTRPLVMNRHCYTNAAPAQVNGDGTVFRYDFQQTDGQMPVNSVNVSGLQDDEPTSPRSESSSVTSATQYSNLPSPHILPSGGIPTPPAVDRGLKPRRKTSDSAASNEPSPSPLSQHGVGPPSVDRKLKPRSHTNDTSFLKLCAPPNKRQDGSRSLRKTRTGPSPTPPQPPGSAPSTLRNGPRTRAEHYSSSDDDPRHSPEEDQFYISYGPDLRFLSPGNKEIKYLDLDLEQDSKNASLPCPSISTGFAGISLHPAPKSPEKGPPTHTVYKTVDFIKTEAFNQTRLEAEAEKKKKKTEKMDDH
ncbi:GRB2-associated-binding protein 1 [Frankliniella occidentalis]|uniref:GRB2-associated-binding protein 1 n=1 Tax=Frankliniella occidentalis TaxID=133901 RepID=A0A6J1T362_FRAOC|nr:GRB2-associated-binding protein 1 [Frankliniella occidentalis]